MQYRVSILYLKITLKIWVLTKRGKYNRIVTHNKKGRKESTEKNRFRKKGESRLQLGDAI